MSTVTVKTNKAWRDAQGQGVPPVAYRAGLEITMEAQDVEVTAQQLAALQADPRLIVLPSDGKDSTEIPAPPPVEPTERERVIIGAIGKLQQSNPDHWTADGRPDVSAINALMPEGSARVTAAERDELWIKVKAAA